MSRRDDVKGFVQIDEKGRITVMGAALRAQLAERAGYYTHLPSDNSLLHFQRAANVPTFEEFRDPIVLQGDIAGMGSTVEVINFVHSSQLSGNLVFVQDDTRKCIYFKNGEVRGASSNQIEDRLGEIMFRFGLLTRESLDRAVEESRRIRRPLGNYLLDRGLVSQNDLYAHVRRQVEEIFYSTLLVRDGDFFLTGFDVDALPSPLSMNSQSLLMEGLRRMDEMSHFKQKIPEETSRLGTVKGKATKELSAPEQMVLRLLETPMPLNDIIARARLGNFETIKLVHTLVESGLLEVLPPEESVDSSEAGALNVSTEMSGMVDTFNSVFERIFEAISRHGRQDALDQGLETFLQFYGFVELFQEVKFDTQGHLDKERLLRNLTQNNIDNRLSFLSQALNELLFFEMFAAREWLERDEQQDLQKIINQLFIEID